MGKTGEKLRMTRMARMGKTGEKLRMTRMGKTGEKLRGARWRRRTCRYLGRVG